MTSNPSSSNTSINNLAQALKEERGETENEHSYTLPKKNSTLSLPPHLEDHGYFLKLPTSEFTIEQQYADDISWASTNMGVIEKVKMELPGKLTAKNLKVNKKKAEGYTIKKDGKEEWKECKYLGSLLETEPDIKRRKGLAMDPLTHISAL